MTPKIASVAVPLFVALSWIAPSSAQAQAGVQVGENCSQVIRQNDSNLQAFRSEAEKQGLGFLRDDAVSSASAEVTRIFQDSGNPTAAFIGDVQNFKDQLSNWEATCKKYQVALKDIIECADSGKPGCLADLAKRQNKAIGEWLQSLLNEGTQAAIERVRKASSLLNSYVSRVAGTGLGSASAAVSCMNQYQQTARQSAQPAEPVTLNPPPTQSKPESGAKSGGGLSKGTIVTGALVAGAVGAGLAAKAAANKADGQQSTSGGDCAQYNAAAAKCGTTSGGIAFVGYPSPQRCGVPSNTSVGYTSNELGEPTNYLVCK